MSLIEYLSLCVLSALAGAFVAFPVCIMVTATWTDVGVGTVATATITGCFGPWLIIAAALGYSSYFESNHEQ